MSTSLVLPFVFISFFTFLFIVFAFIFGRWSKSLKDLRTLRLGRLAILFGASVFAALNGLVALLLFFGPEGIKIASKVLTAEFVVMVVIVVALGILLPVAVLVLTIRMWRRESKNLANFLLPIVFIIFLVVSTLYSQTAKLNADGDWLRALATTYPVLSTYLSWQFFVFLVGSWRYGRRVKLGSTKYFVVLGSGLIKGDKVGKLLANRIKAAVEASSDETIFVMSGGKGDDEHLSEAEAMKRYAVEELSIAPERIMLEDQSRNTYENLMNSQKLLQNEHFIFFTSDFHVFRAALFAASLGIATDGGPGGKTAFYYRVPAFIREFIAVLNSHRKKHIVIISIVVLFFGAIAALLFRYSRH